MAAMLRVKNLEKFQHYGNRTPPWIKLHRSILTDYHFRRLSDDAKAHLMLLWVVASGCENAMHDDPDWLQGVIGARTPLDIDALVSAGFIERYDADERKRHASKPLARRKQSARLEKRREEERREREEKEKSAAAPAGGGWVAEAVRRWAEFIGVVPHGRMGRELAPAVAIYGEPAVLAAVTEFGQWRRDNLGDFGERIPGLPYFVANIRAHIPHNLLPKPGEAA